MWDDPDKIHKAKMNQCRNWWNPQWRDRILAVMNYLANDEETIILKLGNAKNLLVNMDKIPKKFSCPVTLNEEVKDKKNKSDEIDDTEDDLIEDYIENEEYDFEDDDEDYL